MNVKEAIDIIKQALNIANQHDFKGFSLEGSASIQNSINIIENEFTSKAQEPKTKEKA